MCPAEPGELDGLRGAPVRPPQRLDEDCSLSLIRGFSSFGPRDRRSRQGRCRARLSELERKVRYLERFTIGEYHSPLDNMLELADVAGPCEPGKQVQYLGGRSAHRALVFVGRAGDEVVRQDRQVFRSAAQGRQEKLNSVETVQKVATEQALAFAQVKVHVRRRHNPSLGQRFLGSADAYDRLVLDRSEQLCLQRQAHVADFVKEDGPFARQLELARARRDPGRGACFHPEEFGLEQGLRHCGAVDRDKGMVSARR